MNRRERERQERREAILSAAKNIFAEKGFDAAVLDDIAEKAEFSKGAIYGYFKNKDDLFLSLIEEGLNGLSEIIKGVVEKSFSPIEKIKDLIQRVLVYLEENKDFFRIFTPERGGFTKKKHPEVLKRILPKHQKNIEMVSQVMKEGIRTGVLKKIEPTSLTFALFGLIHSSIGKWVMSGGKGSLKRDTDVITSIFLDGVRA